jgi:hypothetical protein
MARASRYPPIDPPGPIAWYLGTMNASAGPVSSALRRILRMIVRNPPIAALLVPRFAVVAASEPVAVETAPAALADPAVPPSVRSSRVPPVLVTGGEEAWGRIRLLAFEPGATAPSTIVEIVRRAEFDEATRHEHEVLLDLRSRMDAATRSTVPEPIALLPPEGARRGCRRQPGQAPVGPRISALVCRRPVRTASRALLSGAGQAPCSG